MPESPVPTEPCVKMARSQLTEIVRRAIHPSILPYYGLILLYLVTLTPHRQSVPERASSCLLKVLPICYLILYTSTRSHKHTGGQSTLSAQRNSNPSAIDFSSTRYIVCALLASILGDICLVYDSLFKEGILFFAVAQLFYLLYFRRKYKRGFVSWIAVPVGALLYMTLYPGVPGWLLPVLVLLYDTIIHAMMFYAIAGYESSPSASSLASALGAPVFVCSDFLIALNKWIIPTPHANASILMTYYLAQLLLTLGKH